MDKLEKGKTTRIHLVVSKRLYDEFRQACGTADSDEVLREIIRAFVTRRQTRKLFRNLLTNPKGPII